MSGRKSHVDFGRRVFGSYPFRITPSSVLRTSGSARVLDRIPGSNAKLAVCITSAFPTVLSLTPSQGYCYLVSGVLGSLPLLLTSSLGPQYWWSLEFEDQTQGFLCARLCCCVALMDGQRTFVGLVCFCFGDTPSGTQGFLLAGFGNLWDARDQS